MDQPSLYGEAVDPLKAIRKAPDPVNQAFGRWWDEVWSELKGGRFVWSAKERAAVDKVRAAAQGDFELMKRRAVEMLYSKDDWIVQNALPSLLVSKWNTLGARDEAPAAAEDASRAPVEALFAWLKGAYSCRVTPQMQATWAAELVEHTEDELLHAARTVMRGERYKRSVPNLEEIQRALTRNGEASRREAQDASHDVPAELVVQIERERASRTPPSKDDPRFMELARIVLAADNDFYRATLPLLVTGYFALENLGDLRGWWRDNVGAMPPNQQVRSCRVKELTEELRVDLKVRMASA